MMFPTGSSRFLPHETQNFLLLSFPHDKQNQLSLYRLRIYSSPANSFCASIMLFPHSPQKLPSFYSPHTHVHVSATHVTVIHIAMISAIKKAAVFLICILRLWLRGHFLSIVYSIHDGMSIQKPFAAEKRRPRFRVADAVSISCNESALISCSLPWDTCPAAGSTGTWGGHPRWPPAGDPHPSGP